MSVADKIKFNSFDSLFGANSLNDTESINIDLLQEFQNHPFKVLDDSNMENLIESIKENGVLNPIIARKKGDTYEIISGHRRVHACKALNISTIPALVRNLTDDEAIVLMVDSNIQREEILPSEKAFSYKMKLEALKRQGKRTDLNENGDKKLSVEVLAEETGESRNQIQRYVRLTHLPKELLDLIDIKRIPLNVGYEISFLTDEELLNLSTAIDEINVIPSIKQSSRMKELSKDGKLTPEVIEVILTEEKEQPKKVNLKAKTLSQFFPPDYSNEQMEDIILKLLEQWAKKQKLK